MAVKNTLTSTECYKLNHHARQADADNPIAPVRDVARIALDNACGKWKGDDFMVPLGYAQVLVDEAQKLVIHHRNIRNRTPECLAGGAA